MECASQESKAEEVPRGKHFIANRAEGAFYSKQLAA